MTQDKPSLWIDVQTETYYLIPETAVLPSGTLVLLSLTGESQQVDPDVATRYKISRAEAEQHLQTRVQTLLEGMGDSLADLLEPFLPAPTSTQIPETAVSLFAQLTGTSPEALRQDPRLAQQGLQSMMAQLANILEQSFSNQDANVAEATQSVQALSQRLQSAGIDFNNEQLESLPQQLHLWYANTSDKEAFEQVVAQLRQFSQTEYGQQVSLETILADLRQTVTSLLTPEDPTVAPYNRAREAVRESMKPRTFDFKTVWADHQQQKKEDQRDES